MTHASEILEEAREIVTGARSADYGGAERSFEEIAAHWSWWLSGRLSAPLTAHDVAQMMAGLKQARLKANPTHRDSAVDQAGYAALAAEVARTESTLEEQT